MNNIQVTLSDEQSASLKQHIFNITKDSIEEAKRVAGLDKPFLKQKYAAQFVGVSINKFKEFEKQGMPTIIIDGMKLYSKDDIVRWVLEHQK